MRCITILLLGLLMSTSSLAQMSAGSVSDYPAGQHSLLLAARALSAGEAAARARSVYPGRVLSVKRIRSNGRLLYRIKILTRRGAVRVVFVDARSGAVQ